MITPEPAAFEARAFGLAYGAARILEDVSFTVPRRSVAAIIGPSGCGKSTFLRSINRLNDLITSTPGITAIWWSRGISVFEPVPIWWTSGSRWEWSSSDPTPSPSRSSTTWPTGRPSTGSAPGAIGRPWWSGASAGRHSGMK